MATDEQSPPFWHGFGTQDVISISQSSPVNPALQLHMKPVGKKCIIFKKIISFRNLNVKKKDFKASISKTSVSVFADLLKAGCCRQLH